MPTGRSFSALEVEMVERVRSEHFPFFADFPDSMKAEIERSDARAYCTLDRRSLRELRQNAIHNVSTCSVVKEPYLDLAVNACFGLRQAVLRWMLEGAGHTESMFWISYFATLFVRCVDKNMDDDDAALDDDPFYVLIGGLGTLALIRMLSSQDPSRDGPEDAVEFERMFLAYFWGLDHKLCAERPRNWRAEALVMKSDRPELSGREIAAAVGIDPGNLSRCPAYQRARKVGSGVSIRHGSKYSGNIEAID